MRPSDATYRQHTQGVSIYSLGYTHITPFTDIHFETLPVTRLVKVCSTVIWHAHTIYIITHVAAFNEATQPISFQGKIEM